MFLDIKYKQYVLYTKKDSTLQIVAQRKNSEQNCLRTSSQTKTPLGVPKNIKSSTFKGHKGEHNIATR